MQNVFGPIFDANKSDRKPTADEYIKNGLIYCKHCNTPRETDVLNPFTGKHQKVRCICKCQQAEQEAEAERMRIDDNRRRMDRMRKQCFGDSDYSEYTFANDDGKDPANTRRMQNYAEHFTTFADKGQGLLLFGGTGTGKSYHSACVANALMDRGYSVLMASVPTMVRNIQRNTYGDIDPLSEAIKADLLILDDLGAERGTDYAREQVYSVVDGRYAKRKPMIVSTNLSVQDMTTTQDITLQRVYSRIFERCFPLKYAGTDRRLSNDDRAEMAQILDM